MVTGPLVFAASPPDLGPASCLGSRFGRKGQRSGFQHHVGPPSRAQGQAGMLVLVQSSGLAWGGGEYGKEPVFPPGQCDFPWLLPQGLLEPCPGQEAAGKPTGPSPRARERGPAPQTRGPRPRNRGNAAFATSLDTPAPSVLRAEEGERVRPHSPLLFQGGAVFLGPSGPSPPGMGRGCGWPACEGVRVQAAPPEGHPVPGLQVAMPLLRRHRSCWDPRRGPVRACGGSCGLRARRLHERPALPWAPGAGRGFSTDMLRRGRRGQMQPSGSCSKIVSTETYSPLPRSLCGQDTPAHVP